MEVQVYHNLGKHIIRFGGQSSWSNVTQAQDVEVEIIVDYVRVPEDDYDCASVIALFDNEEWDTSELGDIYTDSMFKEGVRAVIVENGEYLPVHTLVS